MERNIKLTFFACLTLAFAYSHSPAQVLEKDSLALVALFDATDGANWTSNTNWKTGPVATWFGIVTEGGRVTEVRLSSNNLAGTIPPGFGTLDALDDLRLDNNGLTGEIPNALDGLTLLRLLNLTNNNLRGNLPPFFGQLSRLTLVAVGDNQLEGEITPNLFSFPPRGERLLAISNNFFTGLPDLSDVEGFLTIFADNNRLTFEDIEPNISQSSQRPAFLYSPQRPVYDTIRVTIGANASLTVGAEIPGSANRYQWYKDGNIIPGATSADFTLANAAMADAGSYTCQVTSDAVSGLTIERRPVEVTVEARAATAFCQTANIDATIADATAAYTWETEQTTPVIDITQPGTYRVTIETSDFTLVEQYVAELATPALVPGVDLSFEIQVNGQGLAQDQALLKDGPVQFRNTSQAGNNFRWDFGDGTSSESEGPTHQFRRQGMYTVRLSAQDDEGCDAVFEQAVNVQTLFVAEAITPNGDGDNDQWFVEPFLYPASLRVVNRWGQEVYYAKAYQNDFDGASLAAGVYFYELVVEGIDKKVTGNINILK